MASGGLTNIVNKVKSTAIAVAGELTPVLKNSKFKESGMITPDEFVSAGDYLVYHCPTWHWESGDASRRKAYLPLDKQFLVTKNVPCYRRCHQMAVIPENEKVIQLGNDDDEGWVDTHHNVHIAAEVVGDMTLEGDNPAVAATSSTSEDMALVGRTTNDDDSDSDDEPAMDIEEYAEEEDPAALVVPPPAAVQRKSSGAGDGEVLHTRTYDLNITYDNFYRTPRLWLFGYSETGKPLAEEEMYEDISQDHLNKTVTVDQHPHLPPPPRASVHPCRHAELMKKVMTMMEEDGRELEVHSYLLVFLKFVQAVMPTIEYDYTHQLSLTSA